MDRGLKAQDMPQGTTQDTGRLSAMFLHRSNSVGNEGRKRKERSSAGSGELPAVKRKIDSTAFVVMEALEAAKHQYTILEKAAKENKNTHRDIKDAVSRLGKAMEVLRRDSTKGWLEANKWERIEVPTYDVDCQTDPLGVGVTEGTQTERVIQQRGARIEETEATMSEATEAKARVLWSTAQEMKSKTGKTLKVGSAVSLSRCTGVSLDGEAVETSTRTTWYMVVAEKEGEIKESDMTACLISLAGKLAEKETREVAMLRDKHWEQTKRLAKQEEAMKGMVVTGHKDRKSTWSQVVAGGQMDKGPEPRQTPTRKKEAVIVKTTEGGYNQVLQKVRADLAKAKVNVAAIRKTRAGDILVEAAGLANRGLVKTALAGSHNIRIAGDRVPVIIKGMDALGTKEEVLEAVKTVIGDEAPIEMGEMWATYGDTKAVRIHTTAEVAEKLNQAGSVHVGPVRCRVKAKEKTWCYRCWGEGHVAAKCTGPDRKGMCYRCGEEGHKALDCRREEKCLTCSKKGHRTGSASCGGRENFQAPADAARKK